MPLLVIAAIAFYTVLVGAQPFVAVIFEILLPSGHGQRVFVHYWSSSANAHGH